jgi:uncharacterized protein (TIGR03578 family)
MKTVQCTLTVVGRAEKKENAFAKAFAQIQAEVKKRVSGLVIRIEPQDVEVESAVATRYTERFLGLLFPRERTRYEITVRVTVLVTTIDIDAIQFQERVEQLNPLQRVLYMR